VGCHLEHVDDAHDDDVCSLTIDREKAGEQYHEFPDPKVHVEEQDVWEAYIRVLLEALRVEYSFVEEAAGRLLNILELRLVNEHRYQCQRKGDRIRDSKTDDLKVKLDNEELAPEVVQKHSDSLALEWNVVIFEAVEPSPLAVE